MANQSSLLQTSLHQSSPHQSSLPATLPPQTLRVGVIGCGSIFQHAHLPALLNLPGVALVALYDRSPSVAEMTRQHIVAAVQAEIEALLNAPPSVEATLTWARAHSSPAERLAELQASLERLHIYDSPEALLAEIDLVDVCAGARWHGEYAKLALACGVHVMTEKPMARTWWEARQIVAAAQQGNALYQLCDDNIFLPRYITLRNLIEGKSIGEVQTIWLCRGAFGPDKAWFFAPEVAGGGALMDYGTHAVTAGWFLAGFDKQPLRIKSHGIRARHRTRWLDQRLQTMAIDDDAHFKVLFADPTNDDWVTLMVEATWSGPELGERGNSTRGYLLVEGTEGTITGYIDAADNEFLQITRYGYGSKLVPVTKAQAERDAHAREIANFVNSVRMQQRSLLHEEIGLGVMEILGAAYYSELEERRAVTPTEFRNFCQEIAGGEEEIARGGQAILDRLMQPYKI